MILVFFIKLIVANFIHSVSLGLISMCAIPFFLPIGHRCQSARKPQHQKDVTWHDVGFTFCCITSNSHS